MRGVCKVASKGEMRQGAGKAEMPRASGKERKDSEESANRLEFGSGAATSFNANSAGRDDGRGRSCPHRAKLSCLEHAS